MNKKTTGIVAGAAGAALLMGGATFALWSDSAEVDGGMLRAGNLQVGPVEQSWVDSDGNEIDFRDFRIVPGDTIYGTVTVDAALQGDHMLADLAIADLKTPTGSLVAGLEVANIEVELDDAPLPVTSADPIRFASKDNVDPGALPQLGTDSEIVVTVEVTFSDEVGERGNGTRELVHAQAALEDFHVTLTQVRD